MKAHSSEFYVNLPPINNFFDASNESNYHPLPEDWFVALTDIVNSTSAIRDNRYKTVNILGASPIVGILNVAGRDKIPYTFGGDGAAFCVPPDLFKDAQHVLAASRHIAKSEYNLELRTALIPVSVICKEGYDIKVARYQVSEYYTQAVFSGGGLSYAEEVLKSPEGERFRVPASVDFQKADFTGLECRWQEVHQPSKKVLTLLVKSNPGIDLSEKIYQQVLQKMQEIFGFDGKTNPIDSSQLTMNMSIPKLMGEVKFRTSGDGFLKRFFYFLKMELQIILGKIFMVLDFKSSTTDWSLYKPDLATNSDHRKFDDMLRVVISGSAEQRQQLQDFLQQMYQEEKLAYGLHVTDAAMITCMVFQYQREHVHFVDGKGGGYVSAAQKLKKRLKRLS